MLFQSKVLRASSSPEALRVPNSMAIYSLGFVRDCTHLSIMLKVATEQLIVLTVSSFSFSVSNTHA